ncbi:MAG: sensor histidine kinase [Chloroflexota bacterium]|nr:sensor histidine kinase [Chloroflexota bacterium]
MTDHPAASRADGDQQARQAFSYVATHALDRVANQIVGSLENLRISAANDPLTERQSALLNQANAAASQLIRLCDDVAILTDAASGILTAKPERIPLTTLTREATAQAKAPEWSQSARPVVPDLSRALPTLQCDFKLTRRALAALIENALRFSPPDAPVTVEARKRGAWAVIRVHDGGVGVAPGLAEVIFAPLWSSQRHLNDSGAGMGIGLGLAVAQACVEAQGGRLTLERAGGPGATFSIELPIAPPATAVSS